MSIYQVRFKPTVPNSFTFQVELEAMTPEKAVSRAIEELEKREMITTHCFESVFQKEGINQ